VTSVKQARLDSLFEIVPFDTYPNQYVENLPFSFTSTWSSRGTTQRSRTPDARINWAVSKETCIIFFDPVDSIQDAVLTVPPKSWKRALSPLRTPAVTGPEWIPTRIPSAESQCRIPVPKYRVLGEFQGVSTRDASFLSNLSQSVP
jgi:hypothetical protein